MAVEWCTRHRIGYNTDYDATCPQCTLARLEPAAVVARKEDLPVKLPAPAPVP